MASLKMNISYNTGSLEHQLKTNNYVLRIVMVGKTGVGKSAVGNTILGKNAFTSKSSPSTVTRNCDKKAGVLNGQHVAVIDTPGLFDTAQKEEAEKEMKLCLCLSAPGPHVFLVVLQIGRFTREEQETVKIIQDTFGEGAANYSMVLFTHGDQLEEQSIEDYIGEHTNLRSCVDQCKGGYHVFNNRDKDPTQVTQLLKKISNMVGMNSGSHYTNAMFFEAERAIEEEEEMVLKESEKQRRDKESELKNRFHGEQLEKECQELEKTLKTQARDKAERNNNFIREALVVFARLTVAALTEMAGLPHRQLVEETVSKTVGSGEAGLKHELVKAGVASVVYVSEKVCKIQ